MKSNIITEFNDLKLKYQELLLYRDNEEWVISGKFSFKAEYLNLQIQDSYEIEIRIKNDYPKILPIVKETAGRIPKNFHKYKDNSLCLGTQLAIKLKFDENPTLVGFVDNCLVPYLYSFSYKTEFGELPFGELSHGAKGLVEFYQDYFNLKDKNSTMKLLIFIQNKRYRGHILCPCDSGKRLRNCHGKQIVDIINTTQLEYLQNDFRKIREADLNNLKKYLPR